MKIKKKMMKRRQQLKLDLTCVSYFYNNFRIIKIKIIS